MNYSMSSIVLDHYFRQKGNTRVISKKHAFQAAKSILYGVGSGFDLDDLRKFQEEDFEKLWRFVTHDKKGKKKLQEITEDQMIALLRLAGFDATEPAEF